MDITEFASKSFAFRDELHMLHLKTKSYPEHIALEELYKFQLKWLDSFLEAWQGFDGDIDFDIVHAEPKTNSIDCVMDYVGVLMTAKGEMAGDMETYGFFVNEIESMIFMLFKTLYKLKNFVDSTARKEERCWKGYEPVPGKEPYSPGSCRKEDLPAI